ncbi:unannotated protein [freshwater metagenome]|uniref:Unannotated protein n=1 Tax=freshwater metagenome TaxID=449393 RepID=A0A6J6H3Y4_9ZZZZ
MSRDASCVARGLHDSTPFGDRSRFFASNVGNAESPTHGELRQRVLLYEWRHDLDGHLKELCVEHL